MPEDLENALARLRELITELRVEAARHSERLEDSDKRAADAQKTMSARVDRLEMFVFNTVKTVGYGALGIIVAFVLKQTGLM